MVSMSRCLKSAPVDKVGVAYWALVPITGTRGHSHQNFNQSASLVVLGLSHKAILGIYFMCCFCHYFLILWLSHGLEMSTTVLECIETTLCIYVVRDMICFHIRMPSCASHVRQWSCHVNKVGIWVSCCQIAWSSVCEVAYFVTTMLECLPQAYIEGICCKLWFVLTWECRVSAAAEAGHLLDQHGGCQDTQSTCQQ